MKSPTKKERAINILCETNTIRGVLEEMHARDATDDPTLQADIPMYVKTLLYLTGEIRREARALAYPGDPINPNVDV